jgi:hypothetical protein
MYNAKLNPNRDIKGSISYTLGERKYFGSSIEGITGKGTGYYGNVYQSIFPKNK